MKRFNMFRRSNLRPNRCHQCQRQTKGPFEVLLGSGGTGAHDRVQQVAEILRAFHPQSVPCRDEQPRRAEAARQYASRVMCADNRFDAAADMFAHLFGRHCSSNTNLPVSHLVHSMREAHGEDQTLATLLHMYLGDTDNDTDAAWDMLQHMLSNSHASDTRCIPGLFELPSALLAGLSDTDRQRYTRRRTDSQQPRSTAFKVYGNSSSPVDYVFPEGFDESTVPNDFKCPISLCIMTEPVVLSDAHAYEEECITDYFASGGPLRSPLTNLPLETNTGNRAINLKATIMSWVQSVGGRVVQKASSSSSRRGSQV